MAKNLSLVISANKSTNLEMNFGEYILSNVQAGQNAASAIASGTSADAGALTGGEILPLSRSAGLLQTTLTKIAQWVIQTYQGFTQSGTGAVARTVQDELRDRINVKQFGAKGDGVTDDTAAIQAALNRAKDLGGAIVEVPAGTYKLTAYLSFVSSNTYLKLDKNARMLRSSNSGFLTNQPTTGADSLTGYAGLSNLTIDGGIWDGNGVNFYAGFNFFDIGYCDGLTIKNLTTLDGIYAHVLDGSSCRHVVVDNCRFLGYSDNTSDQSRSFVEAIQIDANSTASFDFGVRNGSISEDITVTNCYFGANPANADPRFGPYPTGVGSHGAVSGKYISKVVVKGCHFEGQTTAGVRPFQWNDVVVVGNTFNNCKEGVRFSGASENSESSKDGNGVQTGLPSACTGIIVANNTFYNCVSSGVAGAGNVKADGSLAVSHKSISVTGNVFRADAKTSTPINLIFCDGVTIANNVMDSCNRGMYLSFLANASISGNTLGNTTLEGIFHEENSAYSTYAGQGRSHDVIITGNVLHDVPYNGILLNALTRFAVTHNHLTNVSTLANTRSGINAASASTNGLIHGNVVQDNGAAIKPLNGVSVTASCTNVTVARNVSKISGVPAEVVSGTTNGAGTISQQKPGTVTAATYTQVDSDAALIFNGTAGQTVTLLSAANYAGRILNVKNIAAFAVSSASSNVVPIGSATAGTAILAAGPGKWALLQSDGTNWITLMAN